MERNMIDAANGGVLVDKTPEATRALILNIVPTPNSLAIVP